MTRMRDKKFCDPQNYDDNIYSEPHIFMVINTVTLIFHDDDTYGDLRIFHNYK